MKQYYRFMKRVILIGSILLVLTGTTIYYWGAMGTQSHQFQLSSSSPQGTYIVTLKGEEGKPRWPFTEPGELKNRKVRANIVKNGTLVVKDLIIYAGSAYDSDFLTQYPHYEWLSDSMLRFGQSPNLLTSEAKDELEVFNMTGQTISYLYIKMGDFNIFLLLDILPNSINKLFVHLAPWERVIGCEGKFSSGVNFTYREVGFSSEDKTINPSHYCIAIKDNEVIIESKELTGSKADGTSVPQMSDGPCK